MDPRGAPKRVRTGHLTNQRTDVGWHSGAPCAMSALPGPEQTKTAPMPCEDHRRLKTWSAERQPHHWCDSHAQSTPSSARQAKTRTAAATRDDQLVPQRDDLQVAAPRVNEPRTGANAAGK